MEVPGPPPYTTDTPPSEATIQPNDTIQLSASNISGLRDQILDNTVPLFYLAHGEKGKKQLPAGFRVITYRTNANDTGDQVRASIIQDFSNTIALLPFVQGPPAESTEAALRLLLEKVETMIGKRLGAPGSIRARPAAFWPNYLEN